MSEAGDLVAELLAMGESRRSIGRAIGRNDRLIGYVATGVKPGNNLRESLLALRNQLTEGTPAPVPEPPRRERAGGQLARTRRARTVARPSWSNTTLGKQAAQNTGGPQLGRVVDKAAAAGQDVAVTVTFGPGVDVEGTSGKRVRAKGGARDVQLRVPASQLVGVADPLQEVLDLMAGRGYVSGAVDKSHVRAVEMRTFRPQ